MFTIKIKIIVAYTLAFGLLLAGFAAAVYESAFDAEIAKLDARLESHADKLQTELEEDHLEPGFPSLAGLDSIQTDGLKGARFRLLTPDRELVLSDPGFDLDTRMKWNSGSFTAPHRATVKWEHHKYRIIQWPAEIEGKIHYLIQVAAPMHDLNETMDRLQLLFLIAIPAGLLLAGCAAYLITLLAFRPMMKMVVAAEQISAENLDSRLDLPKTRDEVHKLGRALNEMIERIDNTLKGHRQFIADASHELRTPLTIIRTELESVERSIKAPSARQSIRTSLTELDHLSNLVRDLLTLAKLDAARVKLEMKPLRLDELLIECVKISRPIARKKGILLKVFVEEAIEIPGDDEKLKSVLLNLLDNAIKYSNRRGSVSASLVLHKVLPQIAMIIISDRGIGIPKSEQERIFGRFYRGAQPRSKTDGSGLGLAIAQRFVALHGGKITVESEEGKGSTFTVELPLRNTRPEG